MIADPSVPDPRPFDIYMATQLSGICIRGHQPFALSSRWLVCPLQSPSLPKQARGPSPHTIGYIHRDRIHSGSPETQDWIELCALERASAPYTLLFGSDHAEFTTLVVILDRQLLVWRLPRLSFSSQHMPPRILLRNLDSPRFTKLSPQDRFVAIGSGHEIVVVQIASGQSTRLQGHLDQVTAVEFLTPSLSGTDPKLDSPDRLWLLSISEDRTFKLWDLSSMCCLYQSGIESSHALTSAARDPKASRFAIATEGGKIHFYEYGYRHEPPENRFFIHRLTAVDASLALSAEALRQESAQSAPTDESAAVVSSLPAWRQSGSSMPSTTAASEPDSILAQNSPSVLYLEYIYVPKQAKTFLLAGFIHGLLIIDPDSYRPSFALSFRHTPLEYLPAQGGGSPEPGFRYLPTATNYSLTPSSDARDTWDLLIGSSMSGELSVVTLQVHSPTLGREAEGIETIDSICMDDFSSLDALVQVVAAEFVTGAWLDNTVCDCMRALHAARITEIAHLRDPSRALPECMPAYICKSLSSVRAGITTSGTPALSFCHKEAAFARASPLCHVDGPVSPRSTPTRSASKPVSKSAPKPAKSTASLNHPLTFRSTVKSSGYATPPKSAILFKPQTNATRSARKQSAQVQPTRTHRAEYSPDTGLPIVPTQKPFAMNHQGSVTWLRYHPAGHLLATASVDKTIGLSRLSRNESLKSLTGHNGAVLSGSWGARSDPDGSGLILSTSADKTARLWQTGRSEPLLSFCSENLLSCQREGRRKPRLSPDPAASCRQEIRDARFYYRDRLLMLTVGPEVHVLTYHLESVDPRCIKPQLNYNSYKCRYRLSAPAQSLWSLGLANTYESQIVVLATSNKSVQIWNMARCTLAKSYEGLLGDSSRPIHTIEVPDYGTPVEGLEACFVTGSVGDALALWDMRTSAGIVRKFHGYVNRMNGIGCRISPCGRFLATGSEDNRAYVYDLREGRILGKTPHHPSIVTCVDFGPLNCELATGCSDGRIRLFRPA
ncbi:WD40-repeat-containing domain protein [Polychytrium aggregatum]|uniref:WD40-repeat-containing domain protein n=1 Tax=Polychytrium aggregatum TaxID=110093 RepID=UPI0022FF4124|nr:WD40-repeat-containing domain protein [Polychytrium aggregatum]KAI9197293.1 WD40-repeat-containing domain protein [Polychytrium aggregatum]